MTPGQVNDSNGLASIAITGTWAVGTHRCVVKSGGMVDAEYLSCGNVRHVGNALDLRRGYAGSL